MEIPLSPEFCGVSIDILAFPGICGVKTFNAIVAFFLSDWAKITRNWGENANLGMLAWLTSLNKFNFWPKDQPT